MYILFNYSRLENGTQVRSLPVYRKDKLHYTPGFSLPD